MTPVDPVGGEDTVKDSLLSPDAAAQLPLPGLARDAARAVKTPSLVLIVDDNGDVTQVVSMMLRHGGYEVLEADSGAKALTLMERFRPDLILCDILMPGMDGFEVFRRVRADPRWRAIPFAFLTALQDSQTRLSSSELGAEGFIPKPFTQQELLSVVSGLLRRAHELQFYTATEMESFKSRLLHLVTHELNTPLSVLRMLTDTLTSHHNRLSAAQILQYLDLLDKGVSELSYAVDSMLLALQIEAGRSQHSFENWSGLVVVGRALRTAVQRLQRKSDEAGVVIHLAQVDKDLRVNAHEDQLQQILVRLLDNAVRFSPQGGTVQVSAVAEEGWIRISVEDGGPGMTEEDIHKAFERLARFDPAGTEHGIGLSLSMVKALTEIHGGRIAIESSPGSGTAVRVWLPVLSEEEGADRD